MIITINENPKNSPIFISYIIITIIALFKLLLIMSVLLWEDITTIMIHIMMGRINFNQSGIKH